MQTIDEVKEDCRGVGTRNKMRMIHKVLLAVAVVGLLVLAGFASHLWFAYEARRSPRWQYAERALERMTPDYDLRNCVDLKPKDRKDFTNSKWKPMPCINTATSNYNSKFRAGNCAMFAKNPAHWGFREVSANDAVPGDLIIFFMKKGYARHAAVYIQQSLLGPLCATTMYPKGGYWRHFPYVPVLWVTRLFGSFDTVKYYRYDN